MSKTLRATRFGLAAITPTEQACVRLSTSTSTMAIYLIYMIKKIINFFSKNFKLEAVWSLFAYYLAVVLSQPRCTSQIQYCTLPLASSTSYLALCTITSKHRTWLAPSTKGSFSRIIKVKESLPWTNYRVKNYLSRLVT